MLNLLIIITIIILSGYKISRYFISRENIVTHIVYGLLIGFGLYICAIFVLGIAGGIWSKLALTLTSILLLIFSNLFSNSNQQKLVKINKIDKYAYVIFFLFTIFPLTVNIFWPVRDWDALALYDFRALVFTESHKIAGIFNSELNYYLAYPFFTSLVHMLSYTFGFLRPAIFYSLVYYSLLVIVYSFLRKIINPIHALILTAILAITQDIFNHSFIAYTNLTYTLYFTASTINLITAITRRDQRLVLLSSLFMAIGTQVRFDDPFWVILIMITGYFAWKEKNLSWIKNGWIPIVFMLLLWSIYKKYTLSANFFTGSQTSNFLLQTNFSIMLIFERAIEIITFLYKSLWMKYGFLIELTIISALLISSKSSKELRLLTTVMMLLILILLGGTYAMSFLYSKWSAVGGSVSRMFMIFYPLAIIFSGISVSEYFEEFIWKKRK